ncbi:MAG: hypothetical protein Q4G09_05075 [Clostridia bacterium]|nr:hypothetical protein [Clostridia bacterium]
MKKLKKIIIILLILLLIVIILMIIHKKAAPENDYELEGVEFEEEVLNTSVTENTSLYDFFAIRNILESYYFNFEKMNITLRDVILDAGDDYDSNYDYNNDLKEQKEMYLEAIYNCLGKEYIEEWNINKNNIQDKLGTYKEPYISIDKIYTVDSSSNVSIYFVYGNIIEKDTLQKEEFKIMLFLDMTKNTYDMYPTEYVEKYYNNILEGVNINIKVDEIENRSYNTFEYSIVSEEEKIKYYIEEYNNNIKYNAEKAYNSLNKEYRDNRFGSIEKFEEYVSYIMKGINLIVLDKYQTTTTDDYTQYVCIDTNENYYIFRETAPMQYTVILDTYTLDLPEFIEKYNSVNEQGKVALNIQKFTQAINSQDYKYAYNCLSNGFKTNYFNNQQSFETYIKQNLYSNNKIEFVNFSVNGGVYTYKVQFTDKENENSQIREKTFIMQLNEGTGFEMSFDV